MTPAIKLLEKQKIKHTLHHYQHEVNAKSYGLEAAEKMSVNPGRVFKTLVIESDDKLAVCIIPVIEQLSLKLAAKTLKMKKAHMAPAQKVETTTGYVLGGVSPLGQKKRLPTLIDKSATTFDTIFISGGKRGLEIEISANDLKKLCNATLCILIQ
ncbi:Cys-tRNA(Pro) deacylase [Thalassotalea profundi]|uniref:Cys-tRNA(Pro)/Cys-tRNA(Cys) deacylase n=1 Tax=Thalassotalea profundi TaxID=2036687 RepID=A0ABQ3IT84_9GAMM|nr:Cys-tRNA(Pro) deacylase [Thalassotalea profundi]GHE91024.1 Cys-tRNA(Pro)/Cys-tRNA(Cys) deacylase [Thalassotalea profundi]